MANTSYLRTVVEPHLVEWAAGHLRTRLAPRRVVVGRHADGRPVSFAFDGVSDDGTVGVCVSASTSYKTGQMRKLFMEATLLNRVREFRRRVMVFVEEHVWQGFNNQCDGLVDLRNIEPMICTDLPREMRAKIGEVYAEAAREVGDKSGRGVRVPGRRA
jgi:hypothetical protein